MDEILSLISEAYPDIQIVKLIKTGKEASVYLAQTSKRLMALKIYKQFTKYSTRFEYMNLANMENSREKRAMKNRTNKGRDLTKYLWTEREYSTLESLFYAGASVPQPFYQTSNSILMEYFGDLHNPAPRFSELQLNKHQAHAAFSQILQNLNILLDLGIVHGDLSEFNLLYFKGKVFIIDFPQFLDLHKNPAAVSRLEKDFNNIESYFSKYLGNNFVHSELEKIWI